MQGEEAGYDGELVLWNNSFNGGDSDKFELSSRQVDASDEPKNRRYGSEYEPETNVYGSKYEP